MAAKKAKKPAITGFGRPAGIIDDVFAPLGEQAVKRVRKLARSAAKEEDKWIKSIGRGASDSGKAAAKEQLVLEEFIARNQGISLKEARNLINKTPVGGKWVRMKNVTAKGSQQAIKEERAAMAKKAAATRAKNIKKKVK
jgi:hypothetical protein